MASAINDAWKTYTENMRLVLLFSIPFIIAFAIPLLAPLPTYVTAGGTFLRSASVFISPNLASIAIVIIAMVFSLLFLSFAFVAISLIVRSRKTHVSIGKRVFQEIEKFIGRVFAVLLAYALILIAANILGYMIGYSALVTALVGFFGFAIIFYVPSAIVVDNKKIGRALKDSVKLVMHAPHYYIVWLLLLTVAISIVDAIFILVFGTVWAGYVTLVVTSVFILPYFVILQAEYYMKRFALLTH